MNARFIRVRNTFYHVDAIDEIRDMGGRVLVVINGGVKIDLDAVEGEKVLKQMSAATPEPAPSPGSSTATLGRIMALEARVAQLADNMARIKPKKVTNA